MDQRAPTPIPFMFGDGQARVRSPTPDRPNKS